MRRRTVSIAALLFAGCAVFPAGDTTPAPPVREHATGLGSVTYELINWRNVAQENDAADILVSALAASAPFETIEPGVGSAGWYVQITLEEYPGKKEIGARILERPLRFIGEVINNTLFGRSFFLVPIVRYLERRITFTVWHGADKRGEYVYASDAWVVFGWVSLLLVIPSDAAHLRYDMARVARHFLYDATAQGLLARTTDEDQ